jgi:hypothetical protein
MICHSKNNCEGMQPPHEGQTVKYGGRNYTAHGLNDTGELQLLSDQDCALFLPTKYWGDIKY